MTKTTTRVVAIIIAAVMLISALPMSALAAIPNWEENNVIFEGTSFGTDGYYNVISKKDTYSFPARLLNQRWLSTIQTVPADRFFILLK